MPVPIRIFGTAGQQMDLVLNNIVNRESFTENVPFTISSITFDPNKNIISKGNTLTLSNEKFELNASPLYMNSSNTMLTLTLPTGIAIEKTDFYNATGQKIMTGNSATSWNISSWPSGVYFIKINTDSGSKKLKFVKN